MIPERPNAPDDAAGRENPSLLTRAPVSMTYRIGLVLVTIAILLLPVIYLSLAPLAAWGLYLLTRPSPYPILTLTHYHNRFRLWSFSEFLIFLYVVPGLFIVAQLLSILKPLFARRKRRQQVLELDPALEPAVQAFVDQVCDVVGAPRPVKIELDCRLNASVELRSGWGRFRDRLVLRLGLPLVAALSQRELAGVLAHEFGHFTQGFGLRASYLIRGVNRWFERAVNEPDAMDLWLRERADEGYFLAVAATTGVRFSRWLLTALRDTGKMASCLLLRQMEHDADSYEIRLAGSAAFVSTTRRLAVLREALTNANKEASAMWYLGRHLPDNFPAYVLYHESRIPLSLRQAAEGKQRRTTTGAFDPHPPDGDRLRRAREANEPGIFGEEQPATALFAHYELTAKQATYFHYTEELGLDLDFGGANLRPTPVAPPAGE
jgi:Zn-dependent protease with chaperone function